MESRGRSCICPLLHLRSELREVALRKEDIQELKLMEEVSRNEGIATQRELARNLNISLGLVNSFIKRIVRKGYFKITTIPGRRVRYLLTPKGLMEKSRLTAAYLQHSLSYYREIRDGFRDFAGEMKGRGVRKIALVGTGELAELFCISMQEAEIEISQVVDEGEGKHLFMGYSVEPLSALKVDAFDVVCLLEPDETDLLLIRLEELKVPKEKILAGPGLLHITQRSLEGA